MSAFRCTSTNDLYLTPSASGRKTLQLVTDPLIAATAKLYRRFQFFEGEWFLDKRQGIPYYRIVFVKNPNLTAIRTLFTRVILSVPQIKAVVAIPLQYDPAARTLSLEFQAVGIDGSKITGGIGQPFIVDGTDVNGSQSVTNNSPQITT